ncbi:hypothetical protein [Nostoc sp. CALU 1950]|uniref:hypothetical protein n=1 Tax=Nostoc sp. CALU 1950 TaxID=3104321 RepID=UPI003EBE4832
MGNGKWGMGNGEEATNAQCPKWRGEQPRLPTIGIEFPAAFSHTFLTVSYANATTFST